MSRYKKDGAIHNEQKRRVDEILIKVGARCLWQADDPDLNFVAEGWALPDGRLIITQSWRKMGGVEVYVNGQCPGEFAAIETWARADRPDERLLAVAEEIAKDSSVDLGEGGSERRIRLYQAIEAAGGSIE